MPLPAKPKNKPLSTWTALLLKEGLNESNALRNASSYKRYKVTDGNRIVGSMHIPQPKESIPAWLKKVRPFVPSLPNLTNRMASTALILLPVKDRTFALTLGYGRTLLAQDAYEEEFGLKVTLNIVPADGMRVIDKQSFDLFANQTRTQGFRPGDLEQFGLDMEQDILRAVTGSPSNSEMGTRVAGKDAIVFTSTSDLGTIHDLLGLYLKEFRSKAYLTRYPDLDKLAVVRDKKVLADLEALLLKRIQDGKHERLHLAVPDFVDWASVGFRYGTAQYSPFPDLHLSDLLQHIRVDIKKFRLEGRRVHCIDLNTSYETQSWPLKSCIFCEVDFSGFTYILANGNWYQIDRQFIKRVNQSVDRLLEKTTLPDYLPTDRDESAYNKRASTRLNYLNLDRRNVYHGGRRRDQIEPCDLLTKDRELIHVKRYAGSAVLSHLFAQGLVSSDLLATDRSYRVKMRMKLKASFQSLIPDRIDTTKYKVIYAVIGRYPNSAPLSSLLPFFSRLNLRRVAKQLKRLGYGVAVQWVTDASSKSP